MKISFYKAFTKINGQIYFVKWWYNSHYEECFRFSTSPINASEFHCADTLHFLEKAAKTSSITFNGVKVSDMKFEFAEFTAEI